MPKTTQPNLQIINDSKGYYVAFIDVLGFRELVHSKNKKRIDGYIDSMRKWKEFIQENSKTSNIDIHFKTISDSIVIYIEEKNENLIILINTVAYLQSYLLTYFIYSRGAISKGEITYDNNTGILFGKGLISAYELEQTAHNPWVIIDNKIIHDLALNRDVFIKKYGFDSEYPLQNKKQTIKILDKSEFFNNGFLEFKVFVSYGLLRILNLRTDETLLENLFFDIRNNIYSNPKVQSKYIWLSKYFAKCIEEAIYTIDFNNQEEKKQLISKEKFSNYLELFKDL